jgi:hypothetical protein
MAGMPLPAADGGGGFMFGMLAGGRVTSGGVVTGGAAGLPAMPSTGELVPPAPPGVTEGNVLLLIGVPAGAGFVSGEAHAPAMLPKQTVASPTNAKRKSMEPPYPDAQSVSDAQYSFD